MGTSKFTLRRDVVIHPSFKTALNRISAIHERSKNIGIASNLLITGESGAGKDTLIDYYSRQYPLIETEDRTIRKVLCIETPASPTVKSLVQAMQLVLAGKIVTGSAEFQTQCVYKLVRECGVEMTIFNELQHFVDRAREHEMRKAADWIKNYINAVKTPVVLVGLSRIERMLQINEQLRRRCSAKCHLHVFGFGTAKEQAEFRGILNELQKGLGMECIPLKQTEIARRFHFATNGIFDYMIKMLEGAFLLAYEQDAGKIEMHHFEEAFCGEIWSDAPEELNPFSEKFVSRTLNLAGEPYEPADDFFMQPRKTAGTGMKL